MDRTNAEGRRDGGANRTPGERGRGDRRGEMVPPAPTDKAGCRTPGRIIGHNTRSAGGRAIKTALENEVSVN